MYNKISVSTQQEPHCICVAKASRLVLFSKVFVIRRYIMLLLYTSYALNVMKFLQCYFEATVALDRGTAVTSLGLEFFPKRQNFYCHEIVMLVFYNAWQTYPKRRCNTPP